MQNRFVLIVLFFIACCFSYVAIANNSYQQDTVSHEAKNTNISIVREQISHSQFIRITFLDDSCDTISFVNKEIKHFELSEYMKSQTKKLNQMSLEIKGIITHTQLDEIPHNTSAVRFNWGVSRELIVQLLKSKN